MSFDLRPNYGGGNEDNGDLLCTKVPCTHCCTQVLPTLQQVACGYSCIWRCNFRKLPLFQRQDNYPNMDINDIGDIGVSADSWFTFGSLVLAGAVWSESRWVVSDSLRPHGLYSPWNSPGQITGAFPFSRGYSQPRDQTQVSHVAGRFLQAEPQGKDCVSFGKYLFIE